MEVIWQAEYSTFALIILKETDFEKYAYSLCVWELDGRKSEVTSSSRLA